MSEETVNLSVVKQIIKNLDKITEKTPWSKFRNLLKTNKKLPVKDWKDLLKLVKTRDLYKILAEDLSSKECRILGAALTHSKLKHVDDIVEQIIKKNDQCTPVLLRFILAKKYSLDLICVQKYLKKMFKQTTKLSHLELLQTVSQVYTKLIDEEILEFCRKNGHEICKEICSKVEMEII
ncbi:uncharacterized protein VNE69_08145 [Vairimorpha necatrix]|uniref:Uncharacterized protein n=1 Tax=Vairimorpha necatrix TaxID=6039 RepID=A0AAX4JEH8_9MICR